MDKSVKEVIDILEKVYHVPACFMVSNDERWKALDKIMTTYAKNRSQILMEIDKAK
jgi:hypothetical protein